MCCCSILSTRLQSKVGKVQEVPAPCPEQQVRLHQLMHPGLMRGARRGERTRWRGEAGKERGGEGRRGGREGRGGYVDTREGGMEGDGGREGREAKDTPPRPDRRTHHVVDLHARGLVRP